MKKVQKISIGVAVVVVVVIIGVVALFAMKSEDEKGLKSISSYEQLMEIYEGKSSTKDQEIKDKLVGILTLPFSFGMFNRSQVYVDEVNDLKTSGSVQTVTPGTSTSGMLQTTDDASSNSSSSGSFSDYSTTNIQVENVDEADITKTDGKYIYSLSDNNVVITNVQDPKNLKIEAKIEMPEGVFPEDLLINGDKLVVIANDVDTDGSGYRSYNYGSYGNYNEDNTVVMIYDLASRSDPKQVKSYTLYGDYYTSRAIDDLLYVIATGNLRKEGDKIATYYTEDRQKKEIPLEDIKYLDEVKTRDQTLISTIDLSESSNQVDVDSYLMDVNNAYVSENAIYLLEQKYKNSDDYSGPEIKDMFGTMGILGLFYSDYWDDDYYYDSSSNRYETEIYKFRIESDGEVTYAAKGETEGKTINQYSVDENDGNLRVALQDRQGSHIVIFDEEMNTIGESDYVAAGEIMYSTRFIGDKAYLVTFKNLDPLFVFDLSDETNPTVLGELKIPGYSMYLHPYDENHLIGIGMDTTTDYSHDLSGRVSAGSTRITGMKMALFDISDVNNPKEISKTTIGDSRTTSAILTNPKALLFSKEKNLLAIPVNNYAEDFEVETYDEEDFDELIELYTDYYGERVGEGYFVYSVDPNSGFQLRGVVTHEEKPEDDDYYDYRYDYNSNLLRGIYVDDNLFTVSQGMIKVNKLNDLAQISELKIRETSDEGRKNK